MKAINDLCIEAERLRSLPANLVLTLVQEYSKEEQDIVFIILAFQTLESSPTKWLEEILDYKEWRLVWHSEKGLHMFLARYNISLPDVTKEAILDHFKLKLKHYDDYFYL